MSGKIKDNLGRDILVTAVAVAILQTIFYLATGVRGVREFGVPLQIISHNAVLDAGLLGALVAMVYLPTLFRRGRRSRLRNFIIPIGAVTLIYATLLRPVNHVFFPYAFSMMSWVANAGFVFLCGASVWIVERAYRSLKRKASAPVGKVISVAALAVVAVSAGVTFYPPVRMGIREVIRRGYGNRPNIIIITIDALRFDCVSTYGFVSNETDHLDRFAARAIVFDHFYTASTYTPQSMMSMLTSTDVMVHGCDGTRVVPDSLPSLPALLRDNGYFTAGYVNNANLAPELGFDRGFDVYRFYGGRGVSWLRWTPFDSLYAFFSTHNPLGVPGDPQDEKMAGDLVAALDRYSEKKPYFLWVHFLDPHAPLTPPRSYMPPEIYDSELCRDFRANIWDKVELYPQVEPIIITSQYRAEVSYIDDIVSLVLARLEELGAFDDSIIIITADHGEELFDHGSYGHGHQVYEETARVPFMLYIPGVPPARVHNPGSLLDVAPTVLSYVGIRPVPGMEGLDLTATLGSEPDPPRCFFTVGEGQGFDPQALRTEFYTYIAYASGKEFLFYGPSDTWQRRNIAAKKPEAVAEMRALLAEHRESAHRKAREYGSAEPAALSETRKGVLKGLGYVR
jgi:arylsulfatase A-like enzyme